MKRIIITAGRDHANLALQRVLDAEIEALEARLRQRSANAAVACARADLDRQAGWLRDGVAKLQARRDALCSTGDSTMRRRPSVVDSVESEPLGSSRARWSCAVALSGLVAGS